MDGKGPRASLLRQVTIGELRGELEPPIDPERLARSTRLQGVEFDRVVLEIVTEAGQWVPSGYIRARAGGPRWKVQAALGRLVDVEELERRGTTSATRYRVGRRAS